MPAIRGSADAALGRRIVIAGAGFAALSALRSLPAAPGLGVTLVDQNSYSTFQPLLYQVATAGLTAADVAYPIRAVAHRTGAEFRRAKIIRVDPAGRQVCLADGTVLDYDYLILATGVTAAFFGVPGAAEHAMSLYTRKDAVRLRDKLMAELDSRSVPGDDRDLYITVVGGGATGVELAGTLAELRNIALPSAFPEIDRSRMHVRLVELAPALLTPFRDNLRDYARDELLARGVDVRLGAQIKRVQPGAVVISGGSPEPGGEPAGDDPDEHTVSSDITVWAAGVAAPEWIARTGLPTGPGGRIRVGQDLRVDGQDAIFAVGDLAVIDGQQLPQVAQPAIQQGRHAAAQIGRLLAGQPTTAFRYKDKGIMATIGHRSAVVELPSRIRAKGTLAWLAWLALHLVTLLGNRNRIAALVNLSWRYLTWSRGGGVIVGDEEDDPDA